MNRPLLVAVALACALPVSGPARAEGDPTKGKSVFNQCRACHRLEEGKNTVGPSLYGMFGRRAGSAKGYNYSAALKESGIVWDEKTVDAYIADPKGVVPDGKMAYAGLKNAASRADLIAYLKEATR